MAIPQETLKDSKARSKKQSNKLQVTKRTKRKAYEVCRKNENI